MRRVQFTYLHRMGNCLPSVQFTYPNRMGNCLPTGCLQSVQSGCHNCWPSNCRSLAADTTQGHTFDRDAIAASWKTQAALAKETHDKFAAARDAAVATAVHEQADEVKIKDEHFAALRAGHWFIVIDKHFDKLDAVMMDGTSTSVHPKSHLRTIDFILQGNAELTILKDVVDDLSNLFVNDINLGNETGRKFSRIHVTIPRRSFPYFGASYFLVSKSDGHRLTPTIPISFSDYWYKKSMGYSKYGPTFIQFLDTFELSQHQLDKVKVGLAHGRHVVAPLSDKTRPINGGEKAVVRGDLQLSSLQRQKFIFPKATTGKLVFESVDGYLENITLSTCQLELFLLVPHEDDVHDHSFPFGPDHPPPAKFHHHHNSYSRMFHVEPMTGVKLIQLAGNRRRIILPAGTIMEQSDLGILETTAGAAIVAGLAEIGGAIGAALATAEGGAVLGEAAVGAAGLGEAAVGAGEAAVGAAGAAEGGAAEALSAAAEALGL